MRTQRCCIPVLWLYDFRGSFWLDKLLVLTLLAHHRCTLVQSLSCQGFSCWWDEKLCTQVSCSDPTGSRDTRYLLGGPYQCQETSAVAWCKFTGKDSVNIFMFVVFWRERLWKGRGGNYSLAAVFSFSSARSACACSVKTFLVSKTWPQHHRVIIYTGKDWW